MGNLAFDFATDAETALVAIIIPTLNEEDHIEATLDALARQSLGYCKEIIVVDGGSSDATCAIVRSCRFATAVAKPHADPTSAS